MFKPVDPKIDFPKMEEALASLWEAQGTFKKSVEGRPAAKEFVFFDGPPFATGLPHYGHFVPATIKDIIPRYKTMQGFRVERRFGWDCHGLPVENLIEKELGLNSKTDIENFGVAKFNEACRASVLRYVAEWRQIMTRAGRWVDFDNDYKTMEPDYMESIWWVMKSLWEKGLIYEGHYILPYCPRCATVLSNHELQLGGYKDVHDPAITVRFKINNGNSNKGNNDKGNSGNNGNNNKGNSVKENTFFLAWTTTPWTLPSNLALCLGPDIDYVCVEDGDANYILAAARLDAYYKDVSAVKILWTKKGSELAGISYEPLFPYFVEAAGPMTFRTYTGTHVTTTDGTGIVHTAPGFGEEDHAVLKGTGVPTIAPLDAECKFTSEVSDFAGRYVKDCDKDIIDLLKKNNLLVKRDQILHAYPHCWRCEHPLIYRAIGSWFVKVEAIKENMLKANQQIYWQPAHIKEGRFGKWLENARDWAISRNRYWGNPLPIWKCDSCDERICVGSREELKKYSGVYPNDLHKHFVDGITWQCKCGGKMQRIPEVLDCWFESGAMPYAQNHYPFANKERFEKNFPADFISEGLDQTRGWFYTLLVLSSALFDRPPFKNCIVSGLVLAADGKKMSKSLRNYTDPVTVMDKFGADALRLYLMSSPVTKADDLCFSDEGLREVLKGFLLPLWSAYNFFVSYANIDGYPDKFGSMIEANSVSSDATAAQAKSSLDQWILSVCEELIAEVSAGLDAYDLPKAIAPIVNFVETLNNWYIRRSRRRFWRSAAEADGLADKLDAYNTLGRVLKRLSLVLAPFAPFIAEAMWQNLRTASEAESVHLASWPQSVASLRRPELEEKMEYARHAVSMGHALRVQHDLKTRQPLASVQLVTRNKVEARVLAEMEELLREELNVKKVIFRDDEEELVSYSAKANFRVLGKELGKDMKEGAALVEKLSAKEIANILAGTKVTITVAGNTINLTPEKIEVKRTEKQGLKIMNEGSLTIALDTMLTPALLHEGWVRDLVRGIQNLRKESGLAVTDRIKLHIHGDAELKLALDGFAEFVQSETLATQLTWQEEKDMTEIEAGEKKWLAKIV